MNPHELYSNGFRGKVYRLGLENRFKGRADLIKVEQNRVTNYWLQVFYKHKIANLFFPGLFLDFSLATVQENGSNYQHSWYSRIQPVPTEHATFARHCVLDGNGLKHNICCCPECVVHRQFHIQNNLALHAYHVMLRTIENGILPPYEDCSDYCFAPNEYDLVFFEIQQLQVERVYASLGLLHPKKQRAAFNFFDRYLESTGYLSS